MKKKQINDRKRDGNMEPAVSVILPTYNRRKELEAAVDSVLGQTFEDFELLIVDDGSTDGTREWVLELKDARICYIRKSRNEGAAAARNTGAAKARGKLLAFQDSDTVWLSKKLEKQVRTLREAGRETAMVYSSFRKRAGKYEVVYPGKNVEYGKKTGKILETLLKMPLVDTPAMLVRRSVFEELGGFRQDMRCLEDYEFSLRLARRYEAFFIDDALTISYESENSVGANAEEDIRSRFLILKEYDGDFGRYGLRERYLEEVLRIAVQENVPQVYVSCMKEYIAGCVKSR